MTVNRLSQFYVVHHRRHRRQPAGLLAGALLVLLLSACGGLAGEPEIIATVPPPTALPSDVGFPETAPDLALGAQIYAARCTDCHGENGRGDGELVASGEVPYPGDLTDPETMRAQTPEDHFQIITNGNIENLMPPWRAALTEDERWAVALYTYTLPYSQPQLATGADIWARECAECHGEGGAGDGPRAAEVGRPGHLNDPVEMVFASDADYYEIITEGAGEQMPAYEDTLTEAERWAAAAYSRSLALANLDVIDAPPPAQPAATTEADVAVASAAITSGAISGQVQNGTPGGTLPASLDLTLYVVETTAAGPRDDTFTATTDADGSFTFDDITLDPDRLYAVSTLYRDRVFASDLIPGSDLIADPTIPLTIYELTEDPTVLTITRIDTRIDAVGDGLQILQEFVFRNESDRLYTNSLAVGDNRFVSVVVGLPPGSVGVGFPGNPNRYVYIEEQSSVVDTIPVVPGDEHTVQFSYLVPYDEAGAIIEQQMYFAADAEARLRLFPDTLRVRSDQLEAADTQTIQDRTYQVYMGDVALDAGDVFRYELSGAARSVTTGAEAVESAQNLTTILLVALAVQVVLVGGVFYYVVRRRGRSAAPMVDRQVLIDGLIGQIAELDEAFENGHIDETAYRSQRDQLKARLTQLMKEQEAADGDSRSADA